MSAPKVYVIMGNDYPKAVCVSEEAAEARMTELRAEAEKHWQQSHVGRKLAAPYKGSGQVYYRAYEFELQSEEK